MAKSSKYFSESELKCSHTGRCEMNDAFLAKLDRLRADYGKPLIVTSAYRDETHPVEARKANPGTGPHCTGHAIDLAVSHADAHRLLWLAMLSRSFTGIGIQQKGGRRFIHLDDLSNETHSRPTIWSY